MAKTYQEYLAENGATQEEIAVLATPKAIAAYNKIQADADASKAEAVELTKQQMDAANQRWWDESYQPEIAKRDKQIMDTAAENARIRASLEKAKELGLTQVAIDAGVIEPTAANTANQNPQGFDPKKFVSVDDISAIMDRAGAGLADMQTIFAEHNALFGSFPTNMEELRRKAVASRGQKNLRQVWEEDYKVADKRTEIAAAKQKEHDDKIRTEEAARIRAEYSANPHLGVPKTSQNSWTTRPRREDGKKLWDDNGVALGAKGELQRARIEKYAGKVN